ncbi:dystrobrevin beta isoform X2 [Folsomia candida]|uniref:dystrobrevin beta isoform X2 n=1 Tax=Folsomia candida TaxID=158441 RepID=UPI00160551F5|nr:dystrobrevin beta isoform X2 [Folsomia candida]
MMPLSGTLGTMNLPTNSSVDTEDLSILVQELRELGFDAIRFASYRTAAKLRYIQKKSNFLLVDLWNVIEGFRENGLNGLDPYSIITVPKLESVVTSLFLNLNKRLPLKAQVDVLSCARYLLSWLLIAFDGEGSGRVRMFSVKIGLVTLCNGKLVDKFRYVFSLISDTNGCLVLSRFSEYLQECLALPAMVLESPTFGYTDGLATTIFDGTSKITVNGFLDALLNEPGPPSLMWLPLLHSMATVEDINHGVQCSVCKVGNIQGFRYKCQKCSSFNMCQNCFWEGKTSDNHRTDHEVKEYATCKSGGKGLRNSFRKSLRCVPDKPKKLVPRFPEKPEELINLSHIVPPSPLPLHNGFSAVGYDSLDAYCDQKMFALDLGQGPSRMVNSYSESVSESDEEHRLIARYTARLASDGKYPHNRNMSQTSMNLFDSTQSQRDMISQLESRNREIMNQIARLRAQQELNYLNESVDPIAMDELHALRDYKMDLEDKLGGLQDSRRHLMGQLEGLMKLLKAQQLSSDGTPECSPRSGKTPPMPIYQTGSLHRSAPATPHHSDTYTTLTGELRSAYGNSADFNSRSYTDSSKNSTDMMSRSLRDDLLMAADSVTNAMSSLVDELNADDDRLEHRIMKPLEFEGSGENYSQNSRWRQEIEAKLQEEEDTQMQMLMEFRSRKSSNGSGYAVPNGVGIGNGRVGMPIQYNPVNGKNGSFCDRDGNHYDRGSDSLGRRRRSFDNNEHGFNKSQRDVVNGSHVKGGDGPDLNCPDWEDGLKRRLNH